MILAFNLDIIPFCKKINIIIIIGQDNVFAEGSKLLPVYLGSQLLTISSLVFIWLF
jgi:hypothetical protein